MRCGSPHKIRTRMGQKRKQMETKWNVELEVMETHMCDIHTKKWDSSTQKKRK